MTKKNKLPGCLYQRNGRWFWKVQLPGEPHFKMMPLIPKGSNFATKDRGVAETLARDILAKTVIDSNTSQLDYDGTFASVITQYMNHAREYYRGSDGNPSRELENITGVVKSLIDMFGQMLAEDFGPLKLQEFRQTLIDNGLCRSTINARVNIVKIIFKWAAAQQIVSASIFYGLSAVDGLRQGRTSAKESKKIKPVSESMVRKIMPFSCPTIAAMIELQMLTGMRSGEICQMRPCDIDRSDTIWKYTPMHHKTEHHGINRIIPIGPHGQQILKRFLNRSQDQFCFSPRESLAQRFAERFKSRKTPLSCGNRPGTNIKLKPKNDVREFYDPNSYRQAVNYAIAAAQKSEQFEDDEILHFHPHQLRHTAATIVRKEVGLDAARALLGYRSLSMTDDYAEIDRELADQAAKKLG
ncbi:MAG: hypothetical protein A2Y10_06380 [Planctomycetes bacterium GWF2_41_51]|nr:MAG: hypothetical protein A2Y10_06380 [Planctomycetes bacterium GWF2_41_51]